MCDRGARSKSVIGGKLASFDIRPAAAGDLPRMMSLDHSSLSDYVWQLELRRDTGQISANFREVRLPRSIEVRYPRNPSLLAGEWTRRDLVLVAVQDGTPIGYLCAMEDRTAAVASVIDLVVSPDQRRKGAASGLLMAAQTWAVERSLHRFFIEMQSKNHGCIRLAQKYGYDFWGYNDQYYPTQDVALFFGRAIK